MQKLQGCRFSCWQSTSWRQFENCQRIWRGQWVSPTRLYRTFGINLRPGKKRTKSLWGESGLQLRGYGGRVHVYLDANATTATSTAARAALLEVLDGGPRNPSSAHSAGARAREVIEKARMDVADALGGADPDSATTERSHWRRHPDPVSLGCRSNRPPT